MVKVWDPCDILTEYEIGEVIQDYLILNGQASEKELIDAVTETAIDKLIDQAVEQGLIEVVKKDGRLCVKLTKKRKAI